MRPEDDSAGVLIDLDDLPDLPSAAGDAFFGKLTVVGSLTFSFDSRSLDDVFGVVSESPPDAQASSTAATSFERLCTSVQAQDPRSEEGQGSAGLLAARHEPEVRQRPSVESVDPASDSE